MLQEVEHNDGRSTENSMVTARAIPIQKSPLNALDNDNTMISTDRSKDNIGTSSNLFTPVVLSILATETAERFAYFGFRAVLVLYFTQELKLDDNTAISCFAYTTCLANFSPLAGAVLAESSLGRFRTILCFGCLYAVGLTILTHSAFLPVELVSAQDGTDDETVGNLLTKRLLTFIGLLFVCTGTGGIKPCVNIFGADQVALRDKGATDNGSVSGTANNNHTINNELNEEEEEEIIGRTATTQTDLEISSHEEHAVREFFNFFYFCINVGAVTSFTFIPLVKAHFGFGVSFLLPTIFMCMALAIFYSKRKEYIYRKTEGSGSSSIATTICICLQLVGQKVRGNYGHQTMAQHDDYQAAKEVLTNSKAAPSITDNNSTSDAFLDETTTHDDMLAIVSPSSSSYEASLEDAQQALKILPIMGMLPIFWMLYDQQGSVWTLQASRMNLHGMEPEQLNLLNPLEIMVFIPLFDRFIYPAMEANGWNIAPLRRMGWGMVLAAISFVVSGFLENAMDKSSHPESISVLWQVPQITIMAIGEIFLSVTGLEYAYSKSPDRLKGFIMATFLLTTAVGDLAGGVLYSSVFRTMDRAVAMYVCAGCMMVNRFVFGCIVVATQQKESSPVALVPNDHKPYSDSDANESDFTNGAVELVGQASHAPVDVGEDDGWLNIEDPKLLVV